MTEYLYFAIPHGCPVDQREDALMNLGINFPEAVNKRVEFVSREATYRLYRVAVSA